MDDNIRDREFLGQGLAFPLQINALGGVALAKGENDILQAIMIILQTSPGERVMRPEFGCRLQELVFAPNNHETRNEVSTRVIEALDRWEPRIEVNRVDVNQDDADAGVLLVEIHYTVLDTYSERSIIYPFYLSGEE